MMNNENVDIEQMRKAWLEMGKVLGMQPAAEGKSKDLDRKKTTLDRLRERYRIFSIISTIMTVGGFLIFSRGIFVVSSLNLWLGIAFAVYFITAATMDYRLWRGLGTIDPLRMSVTQISEKSMHYRKRHLQFMVILIPMAIALLGFTAYVYSSETYFLNGMVVGIILGAIVGLLQFRRFMAEYRKLSA